ncbi:SMP-30/gluconolactonase/LRE family protein [Sphingomonas sp. NPDC079357]|uniref:SMP-30/gluconolactonase/LRE family protein n=1 Tax=Sphingomonas sp. NPDC079357 TaxID=3364518 RepID=UPI00384CD03C
MIATETMRPGRRAVLAGLAGAALTGFAEAAPSVTLRRLTPAFDRIVRPGTTIEVIATGIKWAEGPVWVPRDGGYLLFSDPPANIVRRWSRRSGVATFLSPSGAPDPDRTILREPGANGLTLDRTGQLLIANSGGRSIDRVDLRTRARTVLVDRYKGKRFNSPNDMHVARDGAIWFTDPPYGLAGDDRSPAKEQAVNGVYRWRDGGEAVLVDGSLTRPNGIALSPDERRLYVAVSDAADPRVIAYDLGRDGMPRASRVLVSAKAWADQGKPGLPDGMKVARDGTLVCSMPGGIMFLTPEGEPIGLIETITSAANAAFGEGGAALYITNNDRVLRLPLRPGWQR